SGLTAAGPRSRGVRHCLGSIKQISGGNPDNLRRTQKESVDAVLNFYGDKSPQWLSSLIHMESPWK
ncbi:MAG: hypothetical protein OXF06_02530, partial [Bacteroidetes bacterium]|nr:hypothetical protein [Bacteroidota bacterium]